MGVKVRYRIF